MLKIVTRGKKAGKRDHQVVTDGFEGYLAVAKAMAYRHYRFAFDELEDRNQAAALAGMEALRLLGPDSTLGDVCQVVRHVLYRQAKANGWRMINYYKPSGQRSAYWGKREIRIAGVGQWSRQMTQLLA